MSDNKILDFSVNASVGGGKITSFNYTHSLSELVGSWTAEVANGSFKAGDTFSINNLMEGGIIVNAYKDNTGLWHLEGKDAGYKLLKSLPDASDLTPAKTSRSFLLSLADDCDLTLKMNASAGITDNHFELRYLVSGSTYAEAVLEIAMFSGCVAYIDNEGRLVVAPPQSFRPSSLKKENGAILDETGSSLDLDGYATHVAIQVSFPPKATDEDDDDDDNVESYLGEEPPQNLSTESFSGNFSNGSYRMTVLMPYGATQSQTTTVQNGNITMKTEEEHEYETPRKSIWRDNQEFGLYALLEKSYSLKRTVSGRYTIRWLIPKGDGTFSERYEGVSFSEVTTETMERSLSVSNLNVGIPDDWQDYGLKMVSSETITRSTVRTGASTPGENMPAYSPPFDAKITRSYSAQNKGKILICNETEQVYEARQVGSYAPVKINGQNVPHAFNNSNLAIQTHSSPQWVLVKTFRTFVDHYNDDGEFVFSVQTEHCDDGTEWLTAHGMTSTGDNDADVYQTLYARFTQNSKGLQVSFSSPSISTAWQFSEIRGRTKTTNSKTDAAGDVASWFDNGALRFFQTCPHYNADEKNCNIFVFGDKTDDPECLYKTRPYGLWNKCSRTLDALDWAKKHYQQTPLDVPVIGTASSNSSSTAVGYKREVYLNIEATKDENLQQKVQRIADNLAQNVLKVKSNKGFLKTSVISYEPSIEPNGDVVSVSHDLAHLQTSVTYRVSDGGNSSIPAFLISQSASSIAQFVNTRQNSRLSIPHYGVVSAIYDPNSTNTDEAKKGESGILDVQVNNASYECTSKISGLQANDIVIVTFPAGNKFRGQVISKL